MPAARRLSGADLPHRLGDLPRPPSTLYLHGELPRGPAVAVVGTRRPTPEAVTFTKSLAATLSEAGVAVLSGGAVGIDSAAHEGALGAGTPTVVVAPAGFEFPFPELNRDLFSSILADGGAYLSLVPDEQPARTSAFFARNACLAALAHVVVVVEAPFRSGARNAARWAKKLSRPLLVVPSAPWNPRGTGSLLELRRGAGFCTRPRDVIDELERLRVHALPEPRRLERPKERPQVELPLFSGGCSPPGKEAVLGAVAAGARHLDDVCARTGLSVGEVQKHVLTLTLEGVLVPDPAGRLRSAVCASSVSVGKYRK